LWHALGVLMKNALTVPSVIEKETNVDSVVQEYMDSLLGDLFPPVEDIKVAEPVTEEPVAEVAIEKNPMDTPLNAQKPRLQQHQFKPPETRSPDFSAQLPVVEESNVVVKEPELVVQKSKSILAKAPLVVETPVPIIEIPAVRDNPNIETATMVKAEVVAKREPEVEKRFPKAPDWAQKGFEVLLFDVCGLKLAVPMESLGKIIKVERETNQLIGRPDWFIGAYNESDEHLYVVDTAKYIMPEKGYDLESEGFSYLIQLQRSKWTLACNQVYTTVRLEPDQIKWRSSNGKRQWLSGTVIEHMCALIHVDKLVDILNVNK
jgi:purine-binding chemotaxis protein CheW